MPSANFFDVGFVATLEQLVETIADREGLGLQRVRAVARVARQAGLIATLGRGMSAAKMTPRDAANLLIAVNVAGTARTAPKIVDRYRRLRTTSSTRSVYFGIELEKLIAAAGTGTIADFVSSLLSRASRRSPLVSRRYDPEDYEIAIKFRKPISLVTLYVAAPRGETPDEVAFSQRAENSSVSVPDRTVDVVITQRTIFAVGGLLRHRRI